MFKLTNKYIVDYKKNLYKTNAYTFFNNCKITSPIACKTYNVHNGITLISRHTNEYFFKRSVKYNVFFKKPFKKPTKK